MQSFNHDISKMPEFDSPLKPIIEWYNIARERVKAPSYQIEAHYFGISLPRLRNIIDVNQFDDEQIEILDKHNIDLNIAAGISQNREMWDDMLSDDYLQNLSKSPQRLTELYLTKKGDSIDESDMMIVFIKEGYCGKVFQQRLKKKGRPNRKNPTEKFEAMLQDILRKIAKGNEATPRQINVIFQSINQERDSSDFKQFWASASLKNSCPKSVELVENWDGN